MKIHKYVSAEDFVLEFNKHLKRHEPFEVVDFYDYFSSAKDDGLYYLRPLDLCQDLADDYEYYQNNPEEMHDYFDRMEALTEVMREYVPGEHILVVR